MIDRATLSAKPYPHPTSQKEKLELLIFVSFFIIIINNLDCQKRLGT